MTEKELISDVKWHMVNYDHTQKDIADKLGISESTLSRYLSGRRKMPLEVGLALLQNMGYKIIRSNEQ